MIGAMATDAFLQCRACGWVYVAVTRTEAATAVDEFNAFYATLTLDKRSAYTGPIKIAAYERCRWCGASHTLARSVTSEAVPPGVTLTPLIAPEPSP
jgi:hypothetical protein